MTTHDDDAFDDEGDSGGRDGEVNSAGGGGRAGRRAAWSRIEDILDQRRLSRELADFEDEV